MVGLFAAFVPIECPRQGPTQGGSQNAEQKNQHGQSLQVGNMALGIGYDRPYEPKEKGAGNVTRYLHRRSKPLVGKRAPYRSVIGWFLPAARLAIDAGLGQAVRSLGRQEKVIDQQTKILLPGAAGIVPIAVGTRIGMQRPEGVGETKIDDGAKLVAGFRQAQRVICPTFRIIDVGIGGADVVIAAQNKRFIVSSNPAA